ncbi:and other transporter-domain-containing protein [Coniella lustricola]|uniref:And other transporter-domain-containing protein n=1 Tax=Coniella lustricola TaxID=2025994 RepID=A0A2T3ABJ6_9PEZI|nr:and other transporter-domain-containing protein [Coniella lustricola]
MADEKHHQPSSSDPKPEAEHLDHSDPSLSPSRSNDLDNNLAERRYVSAKAENPLSGLGQVELIRLSEEYCARHGFQNEQDIRAFRLGALIAGNNFQWDTISGLTQEEIAGLEFERDHKYKSLPKTLIGVVVVCALCAAVQGMDETVVNGAQSFYKVQFGIGDSSSQRDTWLLGLLNSAPYLCCAFIGCWLTEPMNAKFGRRGTVFIACVISALACFWQAFTNTWYHMFVARFFLGFGIGPKSATTPIFAAECAPPKTRGALVMQWQMWTAFDIMMGYVADLAFYFVPDRGIALGLNWRLMMGSAMIPAVIVCCLISLFPESPRWYLTKDRHGDAYKSICRLRHHRLQAARDLFYMQIGLEAERKAMSMGKHNRIKELITVRRNRNAMVASEIVMYLQQFCGVNVIAYYSSEIFLDANFTETSALAASLGFGIINFLFAIPAIYTIDTFGRRNLLLTTFPLMSICLFFTGFSFWITSQTARIACIALGIYLFGIVYSPGEGPVPFTYSAEAYPLYVRPIGMSLATATTWFFNFVLSVTWPSLQRVFKPQGAFGWYAAWNIVGFFLVLFFVPETKGKTLEELDSVFSVPLRRHAAYGGRQFIYFFQRHVYRRHVDKPRVPHEEGLEQEEKAFVRHEEERDATRRV